MNHMMHTTCYNFSLVPKYNLFLS
uniref:Uncharacterized protein n=1 Tax=Rhizophora mucronata TaxID=61149 RepID=A0A2P2QN59_RHIMU